MKANNAKWAAFAIGYQCVFAYAIALVIYQIGLLVTGSVNVIGLDICNRYNCIYLLYAV